MTVTVREATEEDADIISNIHQLAFGRIEEANLVENIRRSKAYLKALSLVAEVENQVCGHILFSRVEIEGLPENDLLALAPVAVLPERQNQGVGSSLIKAGIEIAEKNQFKLITVLGEPSYYSRFGFKTAIDFQVESPFPVESKYYMVLPLGSYNSSIKGKIIYPQAFQDC